MSIRLYSFLRKGTLMTIQTTNMSFQDTGSKSELPRFTLSEKGSLGLRNSSGVVMEEMRTELRFPRNITTFKNMSYDAVVSSAVNTIKSYVRTIDWYVDVDDDASEEEKKRASLIESMMHDMERPWSEFIADALDGMLIFGYNYNEKVYKYRRGQDNPNTKHPSIYNDGLIGWAKLPSRSQDTIDKFIWDKENRELLGINQNLALIPNSIKTYNRQDRKIPKSKLLMFRTDPVGDNPMGRSPLRGAYLAWRFKTSLEEFEAIGYERDFTGMPVFEIPPEYMSPDATPEQKAVYETYQDAVNNLQANEQAGLILPLIYDDAGNKLFNFELANLTGGRSTNADETIKRWENKILMVFLADVLKTGQDGSGSFALADSKTNLLGVGIAARLREITDILNKDLIPQTYKLNGWKTDKYPVIKHGDLEQLSLDEVSKFIQRTASVGVVEKDKPLSDLLRNMIGAKPADSNSKLDPEMTDSESRSGDGMKEGNPNGTGKAVGGTDKSSQNKENASSNLVDKFLLKGSP